MINEYGDEVFTRTHHKFPLRPNWEDDIKVLKTYGPPPNTRIPKPGYENLKTTKLLDGHDSRYTG